MNLKLKAGWREEKVKARFDVGSQEYRIPQSLLCRALSPTNPSTESRSHLGLVQVPTSSCFSPLCQDAKDAGQEGGMR